MVRRPEPAAPEVVNWNTPSASPTGPFVGPGVRDPAALKYAADAAARRSTSPLKYDEPVGGPPTSIPRLDGEFNRDGPRMTMSEHAQAQRGAPSAHVIPGMDALLPIDVLPEQAKNDEAFRPGGTGSMVAQNQPYLALKYGVVRNGRFIPPQILIGATDPKLKPQTVEGLKAVEDFNRKRAEYEQGGKTKEQGDTALAEKAASAGPAGTSAEVKGERREKPLTEEERKALLADMDEFDLSRFRDAVMRDMLNNEEQKKIIEARLQPLAIDDLIVNGRVFQTVPIIPNKFEPEYQSYSGDEDLALKRLIAAEVKSLEPSDRYILDKYSIMGLSVSLRAINKRQLPNHEDKDGNFDEEEFWKKFQVVSRFNFHMLASLAINWFWFDVRVRKLFVADNVGNG